MKRPLDASAHWPRGKSPFVDDGTRQDENDEDPPASPEEDVGLAAMDELCADVFLSDNSADALKAFCYLSGFQSSSDLAAMNGANLSTELESGDLSMLKITEKKRLLAYLREVRAANGQTSGTKKSTSARPTSNDSWVEDGHIQDSWGQPAVPLVDFKDPSQYEMMGETIEVPKGCIRQVIGRGGEMIKGIKEKHNLVATFTEDVEKDPARVFFKGKRWNVDGAIREVQGMIAEIEGNRVDVPEHAIGKVVGPKGKYINDIQKKTGVKVDVQNLRDLGIATQDGKRLVKVYFFGEARAVEEARTMVMEAAMIVPSDSLHIVLPRAAAGAVLGKKGSRIQEIKQKTGAKVDVDRNPSSDLGQNICLVRIQGKKNQIAMAQQVIFTEVSLEHQALSRVLLPT